MSWSLLCSGSSVRMIVCFVDVVVFLVFRELG